MTKENGNAVDSADRKLDNLVHELHALTPV